METHPPTSPPPDDAPKGGRSRQRDTPLALANLLVIAAGLVGMFVAGARSNVGFATTPAPRSDLETFGAFGVAGLLLLSIGVVRVVRSVGRGKRRDVVATVLGSVLWLGLFVLLAPMAWVGGCVAGG